MKKYLAVFVAVAALTSVAAYATDFKKCYKACMKEIHDKDKCTYICDDNAPPKN